VRLGRERPGVVRREYLNVEFFLSGDVELGGALGAPVRELLLAADLKSVLVQFGHWHLILRADATSMLSIQPAPKT
jgi:hypothetical protein